MSSVRTFAFSAFALLLAYPASRANVSLPSGGLYKPTFLLADRSFAAGTAFTTKLSSKGKSIHLLVSCHHVLDNTAPELCGAVALSMVDKQEILVASKPLTIRGARSADFAGADYDISAFQLRSKPKSPVLALSAIQPAVGERISLFARLYNQQVPRIFSGTLIEVRHDYLEYRLDDPTVEIGGTSGAPVLNQSGEVIGINVSSAPQADGSLHVIANPTSAFRPKLQAALDALK